MGFLNWQTEQRLDKIEKDLKQAMTETEFQIGSPDAVLKVAESVLDAYSGASERAWAAHQLQLLTPSR